jgi:hypothetical protein
LLVGCGNEHHSSARRSFIMSRLLAVCLALCVALAPAALAQPPMAGQVRALFVLLRAPLARLSRDALMTLHAVPGRDGRHAAHRWHDGAIERMDASL